MDTYTSLSERNEKASVSHCTGIDNIYVLRSQRTYLRRLKGARR